MTITLLSTGHYQATIDNELITIIVLATTRLKAFRIAVSEVKELIK